MDIWNVNASASIIFQKKKIKNDYTEESQVYNDERRYIKGEGSGEGTNADVSVQQSYLYV